MTTTASEGKSRSESGRVRLGEGGIPRALLDADIATLKQALQQKQREEIQTVLQQLRDIDAQRTELNAKLIGLGYRPSGSSSTPRTRPAVGGVDGRRKRSSLADGLAETIITEAVRDFPNERPGFYYDKVIVAEGNIGQARRILAALVAGGKVKAEGNRPHTRYLPG